jgi:hypothetical protein
MKSSFSFDKKYSQIIKEIIYPIMKKILYLSFSILIFLSCKNSRKETEMEILTKYIEYYNGLVDTSFVKSDGIYFIDTLPHIFEPVKPQTGDSVILAYTGYILNAGNSLQQFITVDTLNPDTYIYKKESVIEGWERGVGMMSANRKIVLIIPSDLAYGKHSAGLIPPYSTLVFEIEIRKLIKNR